ELAGGVRGDRSRPGGDGEWSDVVSDYVIRQDCRGAEARTDHIRSAQNSFTGRAAIARHDVIAGQEAGQGSGEGRVRVAVDLTGGVWGHGRGGRGEARQEVVSW